MPENFEPDSNSHEAFRPSIWKWSNARRVADSQNGGRYKDFVLNTGKKKLGVLKERQHRTKVQVRYDAVQHAVVIESTRNWTPRSLGRGNPESAAWLAQSHQAA